MFSVTHFGSLTIDHPTIIKFIFVRSFTRNSSEHFEIPILVKSFAQFLRKSRIQNFQNTVSVRKILCMKCRTVVNKGFHRFCRTWKFAKTLSRCKRLFSYTKFHYMYKFGCIAWGLRRTEEHRVGLIKQGNNLILNISSSRKQGIHGRWRRCKISWSVV